MNAGLEGLLRRGAIDVPAPDFLRPVRGLHGLTWFALAAAVAALLVSVIDAHEAWQSRATALTRLEGVAARIASANGSASDANIANAANGANPRATPPRRAPAVATGAAPAPAALLGYPWHAVFDSVERATPAGLRWLGFESGTDGSLRLEGQVADAAVAAALATRLQASRGWGSVSLRQLERDVDAGTGFRFELAAQRAGTEPGAPR